VLGGGPLHAHILEYVPKHPKLPLRHDSASHMRCSTYCCGGLQRRRGG
jgi:hypothetical protein